MRIETPGGAYRIIRVIKKELSLCTYLAAASDREKAEDGEQRFLLLELKNPVLVRDMLPYFTDMKKEQNAGDDFVDSFVKGKTVWAVFRYHEGRSFREAAGRAATCKERLLLWEGLLERLFFQKMPMYLRYEAADPANIVVDETSAVWVNYEWYETDRLHDDLFPELQKRLYESFCILFDKDRALWAKKGPTARHSERGAGGADGGELAHYAMKLAEGGFEDEMALYREFHRLGAQLSGEEEDGRKDDGILLRLWKLAFGHAHVIAKCGYWALILALWGLFLWLCFRPKTAPEERERIFTIGTMEVGEPRQAQETEE